MIEFSVEGEYWITICYILEAQVFAVAKELLTSICVPLIMIFDFESPSISLPQDVENQYKISFSRQRI